MMLPDLGATVVKVERPDSGDDLRTIGRYPLLPNSADLAAGVPGKSFRLLYS
jgi:crotonobetainyl-CoA:carnitine CoA-transferase CaiB-like acyl-CoA transferase